MKEEITLGEMPSGMLFIYNGRLGFKSEYRTDKGAIEAYCYESGEMFWGGLNVDIDKRQPSLLVKPINISSEELLNAIALYELTKAEMMEDNK